MASPQHTFRLGQLVQLTDEARGIVPKSVDPDGFPNYSRALLAYRSLPGPFKVRDVMPVAPGEIKLNEHTQRIQIPHHENPDWNSGWISAALFKPA